MSPRIVIRADASAAMGTGHVMRCMALAQAWRDAGGEVCFVCAELTPPLAAKLEDQGFHVTRLGVAPATPEDAEATSQYVEARDAGWLVLDGYHFGSEFQRAVKAPARRLLAFDDYGQCNHYYADAILNQNGYASGALYAHAEPAAQLLLGAGYALLRTEFKAWRAWERAASEQRGRILVTLGGSDPDNATLKIIDALKQIGQPGTEVTVVIGGSNPHGESLRRAAAAPGLAIELKTSVNDMPALMAQADVAISAAGTTVWELAFMQLPAVLLVLAGNQLRVADYSEAAGIAFNAGRVSDVAAADAAFRACALLSDPEARQRMGSRGREIVDGRGADRVVESMGAGRLSLRPAREADAEVLWLWRNDPDVAAVSFSKTAIAWEDHQSWVRARVRDPDCGFYIAERGGEPVAQARFDLDGPAACISVSLDRRFRGGGNGSAIIGMACRRLFQDYCVTEIHAFIKPDNAASLRAFARCGFGAAVQVEVSAQPAIRLTLGRTE